MLDIKNRVIITVTFYFGSVNDSIYKLNKKYVVQKWKNEQDLRRLLDEIAREMNHLSGYGISEIKVNADAEQFTIDYKDELVPHNVSELDVNHYSYWFRATLRFIVGHSRGGGKIWLEIPRIHWTTGAANPMKYYKLKDTLFEVKAVAFGGPKKQRKAGTCYRLNYDYENPFLISFANKISTEVLVPNTSRKYQASNSEIYIKQSVSWWYLPDAQTTSYKIKKNEERERKRKKAEERKQKRQKKAGIVYKDKWETKKAQQVYIIQMVGHSLTDDLYKIGISNSPGKRLQSLNTSSPFELELIHKFVAEPAEEAETKLHEQFKASRMSGEWFKLTSAQIIELKDIIEYRDGKFVKSGKR